jgi:hypothetical protein
MAGQIKHMLDSIVKRRANGNQTVAQLTETKLILKGIDPRKYNGASADDPAMVARVRAVAAELGVVL